MTKETKDLNAIRENKELYDEIDKMLSVYIDAEPLVNTFPSYAKEEIMSENTDNDLFFNLIFNNIMSLRIKNPDDECNFLVPVFIPIKIDQAQFVKLIYYLFHLNEEQSDQLAKVLVNQITTDKDFLFKYFVDVGFSNIYQNFISINHCKTASCIIKSLITYAQNNDNQGIELTNHLLSRFIISCFPFIQEIRNYITQETFLTGINGINQDIKDQFIESFQKSLNFLTEHHISALKSYFELLPDHQDSLVKQIFSDLLSNINRMNQFIIKSVNITDEIVDNIKGIINDLDIAKSGSNYPNIEEFLFYNQKEKLVLTYADVYILSIINENLNDLNLKIFPGVNEYKLLPGMTFDDAFSIFFISYPIEPESQIEKNLKDKKLEEFDPKDLNRWEAYKDKADTDCVDIISVLDLDKADTRPILEIVKKDLIANTEIQNRLRDRMGSIIYVEQIKELTIQIKSELLRSFAQIDYEKDLQNKKGLLKTLMGQKSKWEIFASNLLKRNVDRIFREKRCPDGFEENKRKLEKNLKKENRSIEDYAKFIVDLQYQVITQHLIKVSERNKNQTSQLQIQRTDNANLYHKYVIMFKWLSDLLQYEHVYAFDNIKVKEKTADALKFDTKEDRTTLHQFYRIINLLKIINEEIINCINQKQSNFSKEFIASFILLFNEIYEDIPKSQEELINEENDDDDDAGTTENVEDSILNAIFSGDLKFSVIYRILNLIINTVSKNPEKSIPDHCFRSLIEMRQLFDKRKQG